MPQEMDLKIAKELGKRITKLAKGLSEI